MAIARKLTTRKPVAKAAPVVVAPVKKAAVAVSKATVVKTAKPRAVATFKAHDVISTYAGPSKGLNKRKSLAQIPHGEFGSKPDYVLTERTNVVAKSLKTKYGTETFPRANLDAGILKFLVWKGAVRPITGEGRSADDTYRFV